MTTPPIPTRSAFIERSIDNTALNDYMTCPRKYYYSMVRHRRSRGALRPPLAYGTTWHAIMEAHYKTGGDVEAVVLAARMSWQPHDNPDDHRTLERAISEYGKFLQKYGTFEHETIAFGRTYGWPESPMVEVPTEIWWPGALHPYTGKIDRIYEHQGLFYVEDHKTTSAMGASYFRQFDPSNQMMGYAWLAQKHTGLPIAGVRINAHAVLKTLSKFERQTVMFSQDRLAEWAENYNSWIKKLSRSYEILLRSEGVDLLDAFGHNWNACAGKYGQCGYTDVCTCDARIRDKILENDYDERPWDPMNPDGEEAPVE